jgi:hypothetical protein
MQKYDDEKNLQGIRFLFLVAQMVVLLVVYTIVYTSFRAVQYAIEKFELSVMMYVPVVIAMVVFPILLYKYRQMFNDGRMLAASVWTMATASLVVVLLYVYVVQTVG